MRHHDQELQLEASNCGDKKEKSIKLCRVRGLITNEVEERNDLGETILMAAAAEGRYVSLGQHFLMLPQGACGPFCRFRPHFICSSLHKF